MKKRWLTSWAETKRNKACLDAARQKQLCCALQKPEVLPQSGDETREGAQGVGV